MGKHSRKDLRKKYESVIELWNIFVEICMSIMVVFMR